MAESGNDKQGAPKRLEKPDPAGYFKGESMTRRTAFTVGVQGLGIAAGAIVALPAIGFAVAPLFNEEGDFWQKVGPVSDFGPDTYRSVVITIVPGTGEPGKSTAYIRRGNPEITANQDKYPAEDPNEFIVISTRCAHLGCPVRYVQSAKNFICPCHGGIYDFEGKVLGGPPVRPLDRFQTRVTGDALEIGPRYSVTSDLEPVRARDPGEFTGGIWEYLYPPRLDTPPAP